FADFFYIDTLSTFQLSTSINTSSSISFTNLTNLFNISNHAFSTSCVNNTTIFLYGGQMFDVDNSSSLVYFIDTGLGLWIKPKISGPSPGRRRNLMGVINNAGKIYLYGGIDENQNVMKDMFVLDTLLLIWESEMNTTA
ncbi:16460_t:CDS:1, partial [Acaulospora morrowiae]